MSVSLSSNYYQAIYCPVLNGTSEHLSQILKLWDSVAQYSRYFKRQLEFVADTGQDVQPLDVVKSKADTVS